MTLSAIVHTAGKWREHPVAVTMYSYMFGALFMGLASLYFVIKKQTSEFIIPQEVSTRTLVGHPLFYYHSPMRGFCVKDLVSETFYSMNNSELRSRIA